MILSCVFLNSQSHVIYKRASKGFLTQPLVSAHLLSLPSTWSSPSFSLSWYSSRAFEKDEWALLMVRHSPVCTWGTGEPDSRWDAPRCWRPFYLLSASLVGSLVLMVDATEVGHNDGDGQGDHQHAAEGANGAKDLTGDRLWDHVAVSVEGEDEKTCWNRAD